MSLTVIAAITAIATTALRAPSPKLQLDQAISQFSRDIAKTRLQAVSTGKTISHVGTNCKGAEAKLHFHADGTASGGPVCIRVAGLEKSIEISPIFGRIKSR